MRVKYLEIVTTGVIFISFLLKTGSSAGIARNVEQFSGKIDQHLFAKANSTVIWSPISVYSTLVPFLDATDGPALKELQDILGISTEKDEFPLSLNDSSLSMCTGIFVKKNFTLKDKFSKNFKAIYEFDDTKSALEGINLWVRNSTLGAIPQLVDHLKEEAKVVVVNAVAFNGTWKVAFRKDKSSTKSFHGLNGPTQVTMMQQKGTHNYGRFSTREGESFEVMKMGYRDSSMQIVFILPTLTERLSSVAGFLNDYVEDRMGEILERLEPTELEVELPKMKITSSVDIQRALEKAGLKAIFSPVTSGLQAGVEKNDNSSTNSHPESLQVDEFIHKTVLEVDEDGTKAVAATAATILPLSALSPKSFVIDRPFLVYLRWEGRWTFFEGIVTDLLGEESSVQNDHPVVVEPISKDNLMNNTTENGTVVRSTDENVNKWWVHKGPPEYLSGSKPALPRIEVNAKQQRYQQPEPKDSEGIRFPNPQVNGTLLKFKLLGQFHHAEDVNRSFTTVE